METTRRRAIPYGVLGRCLVAYVIVGVWELLASPPFKGFGPLGAVISLLGIFGGACRIGRRFPNATWAFAFGFCSSGLFIFRFLNGGGRLSGNGELSIYMILCWLLSALALGAICLGGFWLAQELQPGTKEP